MATRARITVARGDLEAALTGPRGLATAHVRRLTRQIENRARLLAPVRTGNLRASITSAVVSRGLTVTGTVGSSADYAVYVHEGTRPHEIRPRTEGGVLAFRGQGGGPVFTRRVFHPGTRAQPFLRRAMESVLSTE